MCNCQGNLADTFGLTASPNQRFVNPISVNPYAGMNPAQIEATKKKKKPEKPIPPMTPWEQNEYDQLILQGNANKGGRLSVQAPPSPMDNFRQRDVTNNYTGLQDPIADVKDFVTKNWMYLAAGGVAIYLYMKK